MATVVENGNRPAEDDDWEVPYSVMYGVDGAAPSGHQLFDPAVHGLTFSSSDENDEEDEQDDLLASDGSLVRQYVDRRGKYDRSEGKGNRRRWTEHVKAHMQSVYDGSLAALSRCVKKNCPLDGACNRSVGTINVLKNVAAESFGLAALEADWANTTRNHEAVRQWFHLACNGRVRNEAGEVTDI